jgi:hypothetical protein
MKDYILNLRPAYSFLFDLFDSEYEQIIEFMGPDIRDLTKEHNSGSCPSTMSLGGVKRGGKPMFGGNSETIFAIDYFFLKG